MGLESGGGAVAIKACTDCDSTVRQLNAREHHF